MKYSHLPKSRFNKNKDLKKFGFTSESTFAHHQYIKDSRANMMSQICKSVTRTSLITVQLVTDMLIPLSISNDVLYICFEQC